MTDVGDLHDTMTRTNSTDRDLEGPGRRVEGREEGRRPRGGLGVPTASEIPAGESTIQARFGGLKTGWS